MSLPDWGGTATAAGVPRLGRPVVHRRVSPRRDSSEVPSLRWAIKIAAPSGPKGKQWGDSYFADDLARALRRLGQDVVVDRRESHHRASSHVDDVVLVLRGLDQFDLQPGKVNLIWVISHPEQVTPEEMRSYDAAFAASVSWSEAMTERAGVSVTPLLQATNPERFNPDVAAPGTGHPVLFVGNTRKVFRPIVRDAIAAGVDVSVYGSGWHDFLEPAYIAGDHLANDELPAAYRSAGVVLNDHWDDMASHGFVSNRIFDAVAAGARVVTDEVAGLRDLFGDTVQVYRSTQQLADLCGPALQTAFPDDDGLRRIAAQVAAEHSFSARAKTLLDTAVAIRQRQRGTA